MMISAKQSMAKNQWLAQALPLFLRHKQSNYLKVRHLNYYLTKSLLTIDTDNKAYSLIY
ncbi:MAG: hypothetical protein ACI9U5_000298 [Colwellia sp.]|jgi:hypothetical protein